MTNPTLREIYNSKQESLQIKCKETRTKLINYLEKEGFDKPFNTSFTYKLGSYAVIVYLNCVELRDYNKDDIKFCYYYSNTSFDQIVNEINSFFSSYLGKMI